MQHRDTSRARRIARLSTALLVPLALVIGACGSSTAPSTSESTGSATESAAAPESSDATESSEATEESTQEEPSSPAKTELVIGSTYEHDGYDPLNPLSPAADGERLVPVFDTLLRVAPDGSWTGQLAESMDSQDGITWTLKLRDGVTFTDGTPLDADAVVFNLERHRAPDSPSSSKSLIEGATITATDPTTVTFVLPAANYSFPYLFTASGALGLIGSPTALKADAEAFNRAPVGAGPYKVTEWVADDHVTMVANPDYFAGEPAIKTLTYRVLPDEQSRENALTTGQIDVAVLTSNFEAISADNNLVAYTNGSRGGVAIMPNVSVAPLDDARVREAIQIAFDPNNSKQVLFGSSDIWDGNRGCLPFASSTPQCEPSQITTDVDKAKSLIADYVADGNSPEITITSAVWLGKSTEYVDQVLNSIGLKSKIDTVSPADYVPALYGGKFQLIMWMMTPFDSFYPLGYTIFSNTARNVIRQDDADFQAAVQAGINGATADERDAGLRQMQKLWDEKAYVMWLGPIPQVMVSRSNIDMGPNYSGSFVLYPADITIK